MELHHTFAELRRFYPHAFSGADATACRYLRHRAEGLSATQAYQWARTQGETADFERRFDTVRPSDVGFDREALEAFAFESTSGAFKVAVAVMSDDLARDDDYEAPAEELLTYFRRDQKLGRAAACDAVREALAKQIAFAERRSRGDFGTYGVVAKVEWRGKEVASDSAWGYETDGSDLWQFIRELASQVICQGVREVRQRERLAQSWRHAFGFILPVSAQ